MKKGLARILIVLVIGIGWGFPQIGFSETETQQAAAYTLGEIVVTGERVGVESIGTVREITAGDIARRHVQTLDQALELLPGLDIRTGTDGVPRVDLRGFRSRHVLLLNGIPFNSTFDGQFDRLTD
jgi:outer membrane receptor for ferrienterochelin and colicin